MPARSHTPRRKAKAAKAAPAGRQRVLVARYVGLGLGMLAVAIMAMWAYANYYPSIRPRSGAQVLLVPTGSTYSDLQHVLDTAQVVRDWDSFEFVAAQMNLASSVKPGRYRIGSAVSCRLLITRLRAGLQDPLPLRVPSRRTVAAICEVLGEQLECSGDSIKKVLADASLRDSLGFDEGNLIGLFIPNTYEVYWNVSPRALAIRLKKEYARFWDSTRVALAAAQNLTPQQASALASIVEWETYRNDERPRIAGVYLNRIRRGMLLQADPTVIFAHQDWTMRRVLKKHLTIDSPYNTYLYTGLPPGPILAPSVASLEAVLRPEQHEYLYFAARPELDGYHNFSSTYTEHLNAAAGYHAEMNRQARAARATTARKP
jgi:UPF0755 protein